MPQILVGKLSFPASDKGWAQVHDFTPLDPQKKVKGRLIAVITAINTHEKNTQIGIFLGREILGRLHNEYFNDPEISIYKSLTRGVEKVTKEFTTEGRQIEITAAVFHKGFIFFAGKGGAIFLLRNTRLSQILKSSDGSVVSGSGQFMGDDLFLIGTSLTGNSLSSQTLLNALKTNSVSQVLDYLNKSQDLKRDPATAVGVVKIEKEENEISNLTPVAVREAPTVPTAPQPSPATNSPVRIKIVNIIDKILKFLPESKIFVRDEMVLLESRRKKKTIIVAGTILLLLLVASIGFGVAQRAKNISISQYANELEAAEHNLEEAKSLGSVDGGRARELILEARTEAMNLKERGVKDERLDKLIVDIEGAIGSVAGIYEEDLSLYLDLSLISSGFVGDDIGLSEERMAVLDKKGKKLVSIAVDTKKTEVTAGPDVMPDAKNIALYADRNFVSANDGIWEVGEKAENVIKNEWGQNILPYAYTGNVYILDKDNSAVWRYQGEGGTFASKQNWFGVAVKPDLSNIIAWAIDGNIWMLTANSEILRFSGGSPINFAPKGLDKKLSGIDLFTNENLQYLYILDTLNSRILVLDKEGNYKAQYLKDEIRNTKKIIVSESTKKIILLEGDKLHSLEIKHL